MSRAMILHEWAGRMPQTADDRPRQFRYAGGFTSCNPTPSLTPMPNRIIGLFAASLLLCACVGQKPSAPPPKPPPPANEPKTQAPQPPAPSAPLLPPSVGIDQRPDVQAFIADMSRKHGFSAADLRQVFVGAGIQPAILTAMGKPYEAKPWYAYKKLYVSEARVQNGIEFRRRNAAALARAEAKYGVSPDIVTAIIGIESAYGNRPGNYRVIDALATLSFDYPRRAAFFRSELEQFLLLCRDENISPLQPLGSYAGAMGMPQFMPSSFRKLAADGDGDGKRDIWNNPADAIASVARYFRANGWHTGEPIAEPAGEGRQGNLKLEEENGPAYWTTYHNFQVIKRYNNSALYAMAAYEVSRGIGLGAAAGSP